MFRAVLDSHWLSTASGTERQQVDSNLSLWKSLFSALGLLRRRSGASHRKSDRLVVALPGVGTVAGAGFGWPARSRGRSLVLDDEFALLADAGADVANDRVRSSRAGVAAVMRRSARLSTATHLQAPGAVRSPPQPKAMGAVSIPPPHHQRLRCARNRRRHRNDWRRAASPGDRRSNGRTRGGDDSAPRCFVKRRPCPSRRQARHAIYRRYARRPSSADCVLPTAIRDRRVPWIVICLMFALTAAPGSAANRKAQHAP